MRAFTVLVLFFVLFIILVTTSFANVDLTPDTPPANQTSLQTAPLNPQTAQGPVVQNPNVVVPTAPPSVPGIPNTGGTANTGQVQVIPVTGVPIVNCTTAAIPVTGGCGNTILVPVTGGGIPVTGAWVVPAAGACSNPYVVQPGDTLSRIAVRCGTNLTTLAALNPEISNVNVITSGQVIWLFAPVTTTTTTITVGNAVTNTGIPVTGGTGTEPSVVPAPVNPTVLSPSISPILAGSTLQVTAQNFPPNTPVNIGIGRLGQGYQVINTGITDASGILKTAVTIPAANNPQEQWNIIVVTTSEPLVQSVSEPFTIAQ